MPSVFAKTSALVLTLCAVPAAAQDTVAADQTYVSGSAGYTFSESFKSNVGVSADTKKGYAVIGALGRSYGPLRGEIEGSYRRAGVGEARGFGFRVPGRGNLSALSAMANAYFDPAINLGPVKPYVGAGLGISRFKASDVAAVGLPLIGPVTGLGPISGRKTGFAYQVMAGVGVSLSEQATLTAGYRYFATPNVTTSLAPIGRVKIDGLGLHAVEVGVRFGF